MNSQCTFAKFCRAASELSGSAFSQLRKLVLDVPNDPELLSYSICYDGVDKFVLWNSEDKKMQVRLHVYRGRTGNAHNQVDISEAHNHRWNFSTRILAGGYFHTIYNMDLVPTMMRYEGVGSSYALHHSQYHSIIEDQNTVSLIVRGPIEKESFQVLTKDAPTLQTPEEKKRKTMTLADYERVLGQLCHLKII